MDTLLSDGSKIKNLGQEPQTSMRHRLSQTTRTQGASAAWALCMALMRSGGTSSTG